jgi:hypothetical protein
MSNSKPDYASYLLRLRCVSTGGRRAWTASLQSTATSAEQRFADINALIEFLQTEFGKCEPVIETGRSTERSEGMP